MSEEFGRATSFYDIHTRGFWVGIGAHDASIERMPVTARSCSSVNHVSLS